MVATQESASSVDGLGRALTRLGLEKKFLANGELAHFPLAQRGKLAQDIISEELGLGRWGIVVDMIYGGLGKADALYDGDRNELRERILKSALAHPNDSSGKVSLWKLSEAGDSDFIFRFATEAQNVTYDEFVGITRLIGEPYLKDSEKGEERRRILDSIAGNKALAEQMYGDALRHFERVPDKDGIERTFENVLQGKSKQISPDLIEEAVVSDPARKEDRLRKIIVDSKTERDVFNGKLDMGALYKMYIKHGVKLTDSELSEFQQKVANEIHSYDFKGEPFSFDTVLQRIWAKKNIKKSPRDAYRIFVEQGFNGPPVVTAALHGMMSERSEYGNNHLEVNEIQEEHLRRAYRIAPFELKTRIASYLKDKKELLSLSQEANKNGKFNTAYELWTKAGGDLAGDFARKVRAKVIEDGIANHHGHVYLDGSDRQGHAQAYDALMANVADKTGKLNLSILGNAYKFALSLGEPKRLRAVRQRMVDADLPWALHQFTYSLRQRDQAGVDYALSFVAIQYGVEKGALAGIFNKYFRKRNKSFP